jgi:hypothetical protein
VREGEAERVGGGGQRTKGISDLADVKFSHTHPPMSTLTRACARAHPSPYPPTHTHTKVSIDKHKVF